MIIDHRTYTFHPLKMAKWLKLYQEKGLPVQYKYLGRPLAMYRTEVGPLNQVVTLWQLENMGEFERCRAELAKDPEWQSFLVEVEALDALLHQENKFISPIDLPSGD
jgi:hypothetical protein